MNTLIAIPAGDNWQQSYRCANFLLYAGATVYWATEPFTAVANGGTQTLERGTFLLTATPDDAPTDPVADAEARFGVTTLRLDTAEDFVGLHLRPLRIAMYGGGGAPYNHARIFAELGFFVDFISPQEIRQGRLAEFDVLGMPGGGYIAMKGQLDPLGADGCQMINDWVQQGGMYMGSCAGSFDAAIVSESFLAVCPAQRNLQMVNALIWNRTDTEWVGLNSPGVGVLESRNARPDHPVMFGLPERFRITHYNGPFFEQHPDAIPTASDAFGLAEVAGFTDDFTPSEYFLNFSDYSAAADADMIVRQAAQLGVYNVIAGYNGTGRVILFGSHPEFGYNLAMDAYDIPAQMLANAAFWQAGHIAAARTTARKTVTGSTYGIPLGSGLQRLSSRIDTITAAAHDLAARDVSSAQWLSDPLAMSTFGMSGQAIWTSNLAAFDTVAREMTATIEAAETLVRTATDRIPALRASGTAHAASLADALHDALLGLEEAINYRTPAEWRQDFGYEGVLQMLDHTQTMLDTAAANFAESFEPDANPYAYVETSPFQLVVGSYLAAIGVFGNAWFLLQVHRCRLEELVYKSEILMQRV